MADITIAEAGLRMVEAPPKPPSATPPTLESIVADATIGELEAGRVRKATEDLRDPGRILDTATATSAFEGKFQGDEHDTTNPGAFKSSPEQARRKDEGKKQVLRLSSLAEKGYDKLPAADQIALKKQLTDYLISHDGYLAVKGLDPKDPTTRAKVEAFAVQILKNPQLGNLVKSQLADALATGNIDYASFQEAVLNQTSLDNEITQVAIEANDVYNRIDEITNTLKEYAEEVGPRGAVKSGAFVRQKAELRRQVDEKGAEKSQYDDAIAQIKELRNKFAEGKGSSGQFFNPETGKFVSISGPVEVQDVTVRVLPQFEKKAREIQRAIDEANRQQTVIDERKTQLEQELRQKQQRQRELATENKTKEAEKRRADAQVINLSTQITQGEVALGDSMNIIVPNAFTDSWIEASETVAQTQEGTITALEQEAYTTAQKTLRDRVYDAANRKIRRTALESIIQGMVSAPIGEGIEQFGQNQITALLGTTGLPPDSELRPVLQQIQSDPAKLQEFSSKLAVDVLRIAGFKDPKLLEKIFTQDESAMRFVQGDLLPTLILQAKDDPTLKHQVEEAFGKNITQKATIAEKLKGTDWKKILKWLLMVAGGAALLTVGRVVTG